MAVAIVDLTQGKWRLHTRAGVVISWEDHYMGIAQPTGDNTDVVFTFEPPSDPELAARAAELAPLAPEGVVQGRWLRAKFPLPPEPSDPLDTETGRGVHWARVFPASAGEHPCVQIVQMKASQMEDESQNFHMFIGRLIYDEDNKSNKRTTFFGHGAGNDKKQYSFTLIQEP